MRYKCVCGKSVHQDSEERAGARAAERERPNQGAPVLKDSAEFTWRPGRGPALRRRAGRRRALCPA